MIIRLNDLEPYGLWTNDLRPYDPASFQGISEEGSHGYSKGVPGGIRSVLEGTGGVPEGLWS